MAHLDTAYKIGAAQAVEDFNIELQKVAVGIPGVPGVQAGKAPVGQAVPPPKNIVPPTPAAPAQPPMRQPTRPIL